MSGSRSGWAAGATVAGASKLMLFGGENDESSFDARLFSSGDLKSPGATVLGSLN